MFGHDNNQNLHQDDNTSQSNSSTSSETQSSDAQNITSAPPLSDTNQSIQSNANDGAFGVATTQPSLPSENIAAPIANPQPNVDDLLSIKQGALQALTPLVSHLDQTPEEKFKTTMMMIQASDDQSLVKEAFETAQKITDEKARAQALLDVVNEINYFTKNHNN